MVSVSRELSARAIWIIRPLVSFVLGSEADSSTIPLANPGGGGEASVFDDTTFQSGGCCIVMPK
ncbi:MAG TPA: hypothetical protein VFS97_15455 [Nitrososphaeraceae archaeon]|nr:hypothetical protein [Nitrososphaeraceae archaeon]